uniref:Uncharacterized protein n=1 Tax=Arundo donax TaxID=35708 RepID=A0A0A8ZAY4_ARUDO
MIQPYIDFGKSGKVKMNTTIFGPHMILLRV